MDKKGIRKYDVKIQSLSNNKHEFSFDFNQNLFDYYSNDHDVIKANGNCKLEIIKTDIMLNSNFIVKGSCELICDRTLKKYNHIIKIEKKIVFKFGDNEEELSDEMIIINRNKSIINISKFIYEFFILSLPVKRLHPSLQNDDNIDNFVYSTKSGKEIDPRLDLLNKLK